MKKIVFVIPSLKRTGVGNVLFNIVKNLDKTHFNPSIIILSAAGKGSIQKEIENLAIPIYVLSSKAKSFININMIRKYNHILNDLKPDIIHFHSFKADCYYFFTAKKNVYYLMSTAHNVSIEDFSYTYGKVIGYFMDKLQRYIFKRLNKVVSVSSTVNSYLRSRNIRNTIVIYNGVDKPKTLDINHSDNVKFLPKLKHPVFISTSILSNRKNVVQGIKAFKNQQINGTLILVGEGPLYSSLRKKYEGNNIMFTGFVEDVFNYLKLADIFISNSKSEGLPMGAIEAMSLNLPLLLSDIPQHRELRKEDTKFIQLYRINSNSEMIEKANLLNSLSLKYMSDTSSIFDKYFDSSVMSLEYQKIYSYVG